MTDARRLLLVLLGVLLLGLPSRGLAQPCQGLDAQLMPMPSASEALAVGGSAVPLTPAKYTQGGYNAALAFLTIETATISYTLDGTTPTATVGHQATAGSSIALCGLEAIRAFRAIQVSGAALVKVTYFRTR